MKIYSTKRNEAGLGLILCPNLRLDVKKRVHHNSTERLRYKNATTQQH